MTQLMLSVIFFSGRSMSTVPDLLQGMQLQRLPCPPVVHHPVVGSSLHPHSVDPSGGTTQTTPPQPHVHNYPGLATSLSFPVCFL